MVVWSLDNNVLSGAENVEEDNEETGSIIQDETAKDNLVKLVEIRNTEEPDDAKQYTNSNVEESDKETSNLWSGQ